MCTPPCTEETAISDNQPTLKKSKQHKKEPRAAEPSPVNAEKDRVLKKSYQKQSAPLSSHNTVKAKKEKKTKQYKNRPVREDTPGRMKATDEVFHVTEAEQVEEEQQEEEEVAPDQDLDPVQSSPLVFTHRDLSLNSGNSGKVMGGESTVAFYYIYSLMSGSHDMTQASSKDHKINRRGQK